MALWAHKTKSVARGYIDHAKAAHEKSMYDMALKHSISELTCRVVYFDGMSQAYRIVTVSSAVSGVCAVGLLGMGVVAFAAVAASSAALWAISALRLKTAIVIAEIRHDMDVAARNQKAFFRDAPIANERYII